MYEEVSCDQENIAFEGQVFKLIRQYYFEIQKI